MTLRVSYDAPDGTPFPVEWASAELARDEWRWDQVHNPTPLTPLAQHVIALKRRGRHRGGVPPARPVPADRREGGTASLLDPNSFWRVGVVRNSGDVEAECRR